MGMDSLGIRVYSAGISFQKFSQWDSSLFASSGPGIMLQLQIRNSWAIPF